MSKRPRPTDDGSDADASPPRKRQKMKHVFDKLMKRLSIFDRERTEDKAQMVDEFLVRNDQRFTVLEATSLEDEHAGVFRALYDDSLEFELPKFVDITTGDEDTFIHFMRSAVVFLPNGLSGEEVARMCHMRDESESKGGVSVIGVDVGDGSKLARSLEKGDSAASD